MIKHAITYLLLVACCVLIGIGAYRAWEPLGWAWVGFLCLGLAVAFLWKDDEVGK